MSDINEHVECLGDETGVEPKCGIYIPIENKINLTLKEASAYSNIGMNKLMKLVRNPKCTFVLYVGRKKLIKRRAFEEYLANILQI
ncbi:MAG: hypothetical protein IKO61_06185 [Lachnospiraceae bacterium]|nr:hypothetical protein [Lachnospiraceae bacterium]